MVTALFAAATVFAQEERERPKEPKAFSEVKTDMLKNIDARLAGLMKHRECVSATKDQEGLKACMDSHRAEMRKMMPMRPGGERRGDRRDGPGGPEPTNQ